MRKVASLLSALMLLGIFAVAQTRKVSGVVTGPDNQPVPFATVIVKGTDRGMTTDQNGQFEIQAAQGDKLVISAAGFISKELTVGSNASYTVSLEANSQLDEVVVTALGIKRKPKEIGYSSSTLKADQITNGKSPNIGQALSGKVAGLTIYNVNNSVNNDVRVVLRGNRSILGNNQALVVLDGVPVPQNTLNYLNPNDIESVVTLKGGQAASLYGSDGINGALVITTKKGDSTPRVNVSHTSSWDRVSYFPDFQKTHGSGSGYGNSPETNYRPFENQQYGDHYDGSIRSVGRVLEDGTSLEIPYSFTPKSRNIWNTGYTSQNQVSLSGGDKNSSYYLSAQDVSTKGVVPKDEYRRDAFRFNASRTYGKFKAAFDATYTVDRTQRTSTDFYFYSLNSPGWVPLNDLRDWKNNKFANPNGYFNDYYETPWFQLDNNRYDRKQNIFNGSLTLDFKPTDWLGFTYRLGTAVTNSFQKSWTGSFVYSSWARNQAYTQDPRYNDYNGIYRARNNILGGVADFASYGQRINSDFLITMKKSVGDFDGTLILGNNLQVRNSKNLNVSSSAVVIPDIFNVGNRSGELGGGEGSSELHKYGFFGDLTLGFRDFIFIHGNLRYDGSSVFYKDTRPSNLYSYLYYGGDIALSVTDAFPSLKTDFLNFLKIRGSISYNGNDNLDPYSLDPTFGNGGGFPYGSTVGTTVGSTIPDVNLKPEFTTSYEAGFEASLWRNRINIDFTAYKQNVTGQILPVSISSSTGALSTLINAGDVDNYGVEIETKVNVVRAADWTLDVNANYTYNNNKVKSLFGDLTQVLINSNGNNAQIFAAIGQPFPLLKTTGWLRDPNSGKIVIDQNDGWPVIDPSLQTKGTTIPKNTVGVGFSLTYKFLTLAANAEYRAGYVVYSAIGESMAFTGSGAITTRYNREQFIWPNSVYDDGTKYVDNTNIAVDDYLAIYQGWGDYGFSRGILNSGEVFTTKGDFWKLRDVSLTFELPKSILGNTKVFKGASLAVFGRNLLMFLPKENIYTDPEFSNTTGNGVGINNTFNTPPIRTFGATLNLTF